MTAPFSSMETQAVRRLVWESLKKPTTNSNDAVEQEDLFQVDTHLVLILELKHFAVYWAPALKAVVVRALPTRGEIETRLSSLIDTVRATLSDMQSRCVILDITEAPAHGAHVDGLPWAMLFGITDTRLLITSEPCDATQWTRVVNFRQASQTLQVPGLVVDDTDDTYALLREQDAVLVAGSYSGCVYWLPKSHTVCFIWGGHDTDQHGCRVLYAAASAHTQYLKIQSVIADVSNRTSLDVKGKQRLQSFIECAVFRGATLCSVVGDMQLLPSAQESMEEYLDALESITRVDFVSSLAEAFEALAELPSASALDS
jgi:hypothetical protein